MHNLVSSTLAPENWPFSLDLLPQPAYMVGGAVRDALLGRSREYLDLDFVIPTDAVKVARAIAHHYQAGFVLLDPQRQIARVVFPNATVDIAQQEGATLETDLHRRDFTVNAIAYNPHTQEIIDPLQGLADLEKRVLRMVSPKNLEDDPLRLLRGYRQSAQLGFTIEPNTQQTIRSLASHITTVAAERVRVEIGYLLASPQGNHAIASAWLDGVLAPFFKNATSESFEKLTAVDKAADYIAKNWQPLGIELQEYIRDTIKTTRLGIAKLACLVHQNPEAAEIELTELTYSRAEIQSVTTALRLFPRLKTPDMSIREQYFFFQEAGTVFSTAVALALAFDNLVGAISGDKSLCVYAPLIGRYLNPDDLVAHPAQIVSGKEIIIALNLSPSPLIGKILTEIAIAQAEGTISTQEEAISFASRAIA
ncbi:CCA tRNA nucleotidyltransferase [Tolypothrix sp. FACHB-123]|uniref:CCA tRNA nucleotidyltransferase n=1 Tax=Tolypothrix sp. FACHB-123 TaxID=2692868 RepID=UPI0016873993|nr:CCA tRNA nucleotidyltransferase [Tolypothrix sp. FACHB-123]MBD2353748.1 CCA tRNA nucleotidyltransferase [Tolypothrix sp. FACHB-123]